MIIKSHEHVSNETGVLHVVIMNGPPELTCGQ